MALARGSDDPADAGVTAVQVFRLHGAECSADRDLLAVEEPLEIRIGWEQDGAPAQRSVSVTMRTPGHDQELAVGYLFAEGIIAGTADFLHVHRCGSGNVVRVNLRPGLAGDAARLERHSYTSSSCGLCGKTTLEAVRRSLPALEGQHPVVEARVIHRLPDTLRAAQAVFDRTGGLHASALFTPDGELICLREDVGRHNALDKLVGAEFLAGRLPLSGRVLLVSGRLSYELVQKAAAAGIPVVAAVGAPSSLAVDLAHEQGMTVVGFVRQDRFNVYAGADRIRPVNVAEKPRVTALPVL